MKENAAPGNAEGSDRLCLILIVSIRASRGRKGKRMMAEGGVL